MLADIMLMTAQAMQEDRIRRIATDLLIAEMDGDWNTPAAIRVRCGALLVRLGERMMATKAAPVASWRTASVSR